jgi:light-regulated signal transduction histidine kinase (bacteriophytochrome)
VTEESTAALRAERDRLARTLSDRTAQLEAVTREFDQFTHTVSHDLRAPLRAVEGFAQILLEDYGAKLDRDGKRALEILSEGAHKAALLIDDLGVLARLCRKAFEPVRVKMKKLAERKVAELRAAGATAAFQVDDLPDALGDPELLGVVWEQLLGNAVKFTRGQARPAITVTGCVERRQGIYCVRDNGAGFDAGRAERLFGVFQRLHDEKEFEGRGLGLATVQRLIHRHGGRVWAEGKVNQGAAFFFSLAIPGRRSNPANNL